MTAEDDDVLHLKVPVAGGRLYYRQLKEYEVAYPQNEEKADKPPCRFADEPEQQDEKCDEVQSVRQKVVTRKRKVQNESGRHE